MKTIAAEPGSALQALLREAREEPVLIISDDAPEMVLLSKSRYDEEEDAYWARRADESVINGRMLSAEESAAAIRDILGDAHP